MDPDPCTNFLKTKVQDIKKGYKLVKKRVFKLLCELDIVTFTPNIFILVRNKSAQLYISLGLDPKSGKTSTGSGTSQENIVLVYLFSLFFPRGALIQLSGLILLIYNYIGI